MPQHREGSDEETRQTGERLQRVLAARGVASRRAAEEMITAGRVAVNGKIVTILGTRVDPVSDRIAVDGKPLRPQKPRFIMLNKPSGFITTVQDDRNRWTVMDLIDVPERVYPVGRLDRETQGLLLLTNDGDIANRVMHPRYGLTKEYHVVTNRRPSDQQFERLRDGIDIDGRVVVPDDVRLERETREGILVRIVLHEGLFHVVRRMMDIVGIDVVRLRRMRLGPISVQGIPLGAWRDLTPGELVSLFEAVGMDRAAADRLNATRTMQLDPVGGYAHQSSGKPVAPPSNAMPKPPPGRRPIVRTPRDPQGPSSGQRQARRDQRQRPNHPGGRPDGARPSSGHRDRRSGRGR